MQGDGNLVVYRADGIAKWATGTDGRPGAFLITQDDGKLGVHDRDGTPLWAT